jgi:hypothetical protein
VAWPRVSSGEKWEGTHFARPFEKTGISKRYTASVRREVLNERSEFRNLTPILIVGSNILPLVKYQRNPPNVAHLAGLAVFTLYRFKLPEHPFVLQNGLSGHLLSQDEVRALVSNLVTNLMGFPSIIERT